MGNKMEDALNFVVWLILIVAAVGVLLLLIKWIFTWLF